MNSTRLICAPPMTPLRPTNTTQRPDRGPMIMGNLVLKNKKARFIVTYKLLQYKYETHVLMIILGYLTQDRKTPLLIQCCGRCARPGAVALCEPGSAAVCGTTE
ncbi:telomere length regulation protein TEL2 homolog isoform X3 [Oncorhynchus nerka]|uniref:telomere length regulation protein TEL2 homolog isoform X3 n=1 Tax=Oncorhynchus nerka TaxID=8023 RepID=UPI0011305137|nr:telomere length regulation protein TEL2 homolog isoform X3 [Oncorhynchus nerka]